MKNKIIKISIASIVLALLIGGVAIGLLTKETSLNNQKGNWDNPTLNLKGKNIVTIGDTCATEFHRQSFATLVNSSEEVIKGKVKEVQFEAIEGVAWTKVKFLIDIVFKGDLEENKVIDVYFLGGYIPLDEHEYYKNSPRFEGLNAEERRNIVIKELHEGETEFVEKEDELVLCLEQIQENSSLPKNSYKRPYPISMLKLQGDKFVQLYAFDNKYIIDKDQLNDIKKLVVNFEEEKENNTFKTIPLKTRIEFDLSKNTKIDYSNESIIKIIDSIKAEEKDFNIDDYKMTYNVIHEESGYGMIFFMYCIKGKIETNKVYLANIYNNVFKEIVLGGVKKSNIKKIKATNNNSLYNKVENFEKNNKKEALFKEATKMYGKKYKFSINDVMNDNKVNIEKINPNAKKFEEKYYYDYNNNELSYKLMMDVETENGTHDGEMIKIVIE